MQNDMLKNTIAPWQEKGRWYHANCTSNGTSWTLNKDKSDPHFATLSFTSTNYLIVTNAVTEKVIDFEVKYNGSFSSGALVSHQIYYGPSRHDIVLVQPTLFTGDADLYVFIE